MNANILDQVAEAISQSVNEVPRNVVTRQMTNLQINRRIASDDNEHDVTFGQTEPVPAEEQRVVNIHHQTMTIKSFAIMILLILFLTCTRLPPNASPVDMEDTPSHDTLMLIASDDSHQDASELEKNGAASNEASHPTFEHISEETSPDHPSEKLI